MVIECVGVLRVVVSPSLVVGIAASVLIMCPEDMGELMGDRLWGAMMWHHYELAAGIRESSFEDRSTLRVSELTVFVVVRVHHEDRGRPVGIV